MNSHDFESLPPAVRRKFFSNVERLRFRLDQSDPCSTLNHPVNAASNPGAAPGARPRPWTQNHIPSGLTRSPPSLRKNSHRQRRQIRQTRQGPFHSRPRQLQLHSQSRSKLRKPGSLHLAVLAAQADSQCFHSLPAKIQQKLFSPEERRRLCHAYRGSLICDSADEAFYRGNSQRQQSALAPAPPARHRSIDSLSETTLPVAQPSTVFYDSDSDSDSDSDPEPNCDYDDPWRPSKMDQSIYDSFRWLDEDGDLDLSLDEYHSHVANSATGKFRPRLPSFRRSLSFSTHAAKHRPSPSMPIHTRAFPTSQTIQPLSPLPPLSPLSPISPRSTRRSLSRPASRSGTSSRPASRPVSRRLKSSHAAKSSTSSIDPSAQYYYDPDARLKLRVYLASPQKFDEAIEFGFPSLDQIETHSQDLSQSKDLGQSESESQSQRLSQSQTLRHVQDKENISPEPPSTSLKAKSCAGTFFEDDDGNIVGSPGESIEEPIPSPTVSPSPPSAGPAVTHESHKEITSPRTSTSTSTSTPQSFPRLSMRDIPRPHLRPSLDQTINKSTQPSLLQRRQSLLPQSKSKQPLRLPGNREMTLKMTLTRPDLREESPTPPAFVVNRQRGRNGNQHSSQGEEDENAGAGGTGDADDGAERDPLRLAELPPADRSRQIWDDLDEEQGVVRKMWRKLRRR